MRRGFFVSVSVFHNPTGFCLPAGSAHRLLQLAERHDFHVMEDDTYGHLAPEHATRVCALDSLQRTVYVGGFAKVVAPNWRVGFLAAPQALIERLLDTKLITTLTTASLLEKAMAICIEQGQLRRHVARLRARLDAARTRSVALALAAGCRFANAPAGPFGWVDTGVDTDLLAQRMLDDGYLLAPGALFHATREPSTLMRINFATTQDAAFWKAVRSGPGRDAVKGLRGLSGRAIGVQCAAHDPSASACTMVVWERPAIMLSSAAWTSPGAMSWRSHRRATAAVSGPSIASVTSSAEAYGPVCSTNAS